MSQQSERRAAAEAADYSRGRLCLCLSLVLLLPGCVALDKLLSLSEPQVFHLSSGDNGTIQKCVGGLMRNLCKAL